MRFHLLVLCALLSPGWTHAAQEAHTIRIEGESATSAKVTRHPWWYDKVKTAELSGGAWISNFSKAAEGTLEYRVEVPARGTYHFWVRANPVGSKLSYRNGGSGGAGAWVPIDTSSAVDVINIAEDGKPDLRFIGWMNAGDLALEAGPLTLSFKMSSENENHGALDVFVLTTGAFTPSGTGNPNAAPGAAAKAEVAEAGSWAFHHPVDAFESRALLDLRSLNEKSAGESGFVKLTPDGNAFALGNGAPVRFWAVGSDLFHNHSAAQMDQHARFLAKLGVNMVRMHCDFSPKAKEAKPTDVDEKELDGVFQLVAALKKQGIYSTISPFWAHTKAPASWGIDGYADKEPWGVLFFNEALQNAYKAWVREVYTRKNPYTGLALGQDPAVAIVQVHNEDSLLFWTFEGIAPEQKLVLGKKFAAWLGKKYGSLEKASAAWSGAAAKGDDFSNGVAGFLITWELTQPQSGPKAQRVADQLEFLARTQHDFYAEIGEFYRKTLGCKQLLNASNWRPADMLREGDVERWTNTANEVLAVNKYYNGGEHIGPANGWRIDPGDFFQGESVLKNPTAIPTALKQVVGHPMMITESTWVAPLGFQSEGPALMAAYQSLTGMDTFYWFSATSVDYLENPFLNFLNIGGQHPVQKWSCSIPTLMGNFPANALAYRLGYIRPGTPVVHEERSLENLWQRSAPVIAEGASFDPNRDKIAFAEGASVKTAVDPLAFLVGPVQVKYGGDPAKTKVADLIGWIDKTRKVVRSNTSEITLNYGVGVCTLNAPKIQGVTGFLNDAGGKFTLADVIIQSANEYAAIAVVSMDTQPLNVSHKILVQVGTVARPTGWQVRDAVREQKSGAPLKGFEIVSTGKLPIQIANTEVMITLHNPALTKATLLDSAGYAAGPVPMEKTTGGVSLKLPPNAMYVVLE